MSEQSPDPRHRGDWNNSLNAVDLIVECVGNQKPSEPPSPKSLRFAEELRSRYLRALAYCAEHNITDTDTTDLIVEG